MTSPVSQVVIGIRHIDEALDEVGTLDKSEKDLEEHARTETHTHAH